MRTPTSPQPITRAFGQRDRGAGRRPPVLDLGRLLLGSTVVALGVLFLLDSAGVLDANEAIDHWWPVVIVAAGVLTLAEPSTSVARGVLLTGAGAVLLLFTTNLLDEDAWSYVWPALIVVAGLAIVLRWSGATIPAGASSEDVVRATAVFGGPHLASTSRRFQGAWLTAIFGGITLDLHNARPAPEGASVNVTAAFGGVDIIVPKGWRISVRTTPIFGGVEDKTDHSEPPPDDAPMLRIDAVTLFGGVSVKHPEHTA